MARFLDPALVVGPLLLLGAACGRSEGAFPYLAHRGGDGDGARSFAAMPESIRRVARPRARPVPATDGAPASLTASDGTGLALERVRARGAIDGPLAFTEVLLAFRNPTVRRLEGRFEIALPEGAAVSRFAMKIQGAWSEAEVVNRARGQEVYETHLHRRVDPALLEHDAGNRFRARVFPIEPGEMKEILVSYSHELANPDDAYRIPLVGLPRLKVLEVSVKVGDRIVSRAERDVIPVRDFVAEPPDLAADGLRSGDMVVARVAPRLDETADPIEDLLVLLDTSGSTGRVLADRVADLVSLARALQSRGERGQRLTVAAFDQAVDVVFDGRAADFGARQAEALLLRRALGASDLESALAWAGRSGHRRVLLVTDGVATAGAIEAPALIRALGSAAMDRIDAVASGPVADRPLLTQVVASGGRRAGVVLSADGGAGTWLRRMERSAAPPIEVTMADAEWVWPERLIGLQPGDHALVYARMRSRSGRARMRLRGGGHEQAIDLTLRPTAGPLLGRELAQAEIERLERNRAALPSTDIRRRSELRARIVNLSVTRRVLTPHTALLVLESDADFQRFCLDRRALSDLLTVDATGIRVVGRRTGSAPSPVAPCAAGASPVTPPTATETGGKRRRLGPFGSIGGVAVDGTTGDPVPGATIVVTSPALEGEETAITDEEGRYSIGRLPRGVYSLTLYAFGITVTGASVTVQPGQVAASSFSIPMSQTGGEVIAITGTAPTVKETTSGFEATRSAPAAENATLGARVGGTTSLENDFAVDGIETADVASIDAGTGQLAYAGRMLGVMRRLERNDRDGALVEALEWQTDAPWDVMALVALGEALEARGSLALAARAYGSIVDAFPSRADMRRFAAGRLARLGRRNTGLLVVDVLEKAVELRPDHPTGHRLLAYALLAAGQHGRALRVLAGALEPRVTDPRGRFARARPLLEEDAGLVAAAWLAREPQRRDEIRALLEKHKILVPMEPSLHFVLSWENDATDADLFVTPTGSPFSREVVADTERGPDISDGWGPEHAIVRGPPASHYHLWVEYAARQMMGVGFGQVQVVRHDGAGQVTVETRPFVAMREGAVVDLGDVSSGGRPRGQLRVGSAAGR